MSQELLRLKDFYYELPERLIAQTPLPNRSSSRLLLRQANGQIDHRQFGELPQLLPAGSLLVYNDSKVLPGRLLGLTQHGGRIELMLLRPLLGSNNRWEALGRPLRKLHEGFQVNFPSGCIARVMKRIDNAPQPFIEVEFNLTHDNFFEWMELEGYIPLPPYIARPDAHTAPTSPDKERYQTIFAEERGSVAAPTAGLHFTPEIWQELHNAGIQTAPVTLHVGGGTFLPVKTDELAQHQMHEESYRISKSSYLAITKAKAEGRPIIAVGTTSLRCLESFGLAAKNLSDPIDLTDQWLQTRLFLYPKFRDDRYRPWAIDGLMTNFHQPESSLLMLVSALIGYEDMRSFYQKALTENYRFLSYGDTSLIWL
ncbi:MAG: tRNA preQ1(34) S-adenosylmethionine ribosyltransferase-isomerase QueA [Proteobacteria bacterium]|nr:tRNA preQ1(34) S-adenosylmethionine ribosyltransferase-isomerase QueA [Pseudomonadota bacterium]